MLYITTRNHDVTYASRHTLKSDFAPDGGIFVPAEFPRYTEEEIARLRGKSFGTIVADVLNLFYPNQLNGWDVDFCIGRNLSRFVPMSHRIVIAEMWHNPGDNYLYIIKQLFGKVLSTSASDPRPTNSFTIAATVAILFALYGELMVQDMIYPNQSIDLSVSSEDFLMPISASYARKMGLPIGTIVFTCAENNSVWDLIYRGIYNPVFSDATVEQGIERLVYSALGHDETQNFLSKCQSCQTYYVDENLLPELTKGMFCAVPGASRAATVINSTYRTSQYLLDPHTALCHGGMQDYRARTGISRLTMILASENPLHYKQEITAAAGVSDDVLLAQIKQS